MRAYVAMVLAALAVPLALAAPLLALVAYHLLSSPRPDGFALHAGAGTVDLSLLVAATLCLSVFVRRRLGFFVSSRVTAALIFLWGWWALAALVAPGAAPAFHGVGSLATPFLVCLVTTALCTGRGALRLVLGSLVAGAVLHGAATVLRAAAIGVAPSQPRSVVTLAIVLPLAVGFALGARRTWQRVAWWAATGTAALSVLAAGSDLACMAALTGLVAIVWNTRARWAALVVAVPPALVLLVAAVTGASTWGDALRASATRPLTGVGVLATDPLNTYLELTATSGLPALALYVLLFAAALAATRRTTRLVREQMDARLGDFTGLARALRASLCAVLVAGLFGSLMHLEVIYHVCVLAACLPVALRTEIELLDPREAARKRRRAAGEASPTGPPSTRGGRRPARHWAVGAVPPLEPDPLYGRPRVSRSSPPRSRTRPPHLGRPESSTYLGVGDGAGQRPAPSARPGDSATYLGIDDTSSAPPPAL